MQAVEQPARPGTLYVVATPIGNLRDITLRALDILRTVDIVAAEDTRNSRHLLDAYGIRARLVALHEHNELKAGERLLAELQAGKSAALVSDAGTPAISDPGAAFVGVARNAGIPVVPIPGASAVIAALSASGIGSPHWLFYGFLPAKTGARRKALEAVAALPYALVFYEAPHRIADCIQDMATVLGPERRLTLGRELTKRFEQVHTLALGKARAWLDADPNRLRGEFVLILNPPEGVNRTESVDAERVLRILLEDFPAGQAASLAARLTGLKRNELYRLALAQKS